MGQKYKSMSIQQWICYLYKSIQELENDDFWKLKYPTIEALKTSLPEGEMPWFAFVEETKSFWFWSDTLNQWVNQNISADNYILLTEDDKASVPYIIVP